MKRGEVRELDWTFQTVVISVFVSVAGLLIALALKSSGIWPSWAYSEVLFGGLFGATAVHRMHPGRPLVVLLVFVPAMALLLLMGTVLFHLYVLGLPLEF